MKIGIVIADEFEYQPFLQFAQTKNCKEEEKHGRKRLTYTDGEKTVIAVQCGIGKVNAATATALLIAEDKVDVILNAGLSGAVHSLCRGDVVVGTSYLECDFDLTAIGRELGEKPDQPSVYLPDKNLLGDALTIPHVKPAALGTGDLFLTDKVKGRMYHEKFGIHAFDMETAAIASVCHFDEIPFLSIRKISDSADDEAKSDYNEMNHRKEADLTEVLTTLIAHI